MADQADGYDDGYEEDLDDDGFGFDLDRVFGQSPEATALAEKLTASWRTSLADGDPRRHHFVPQCHLRRFADGDQIARTGLDNPRRHDIANVKNVAVVNDLYTLHDKDVGDTVAIERFLAQLDGDVVGPMHRLAYGVLFPPQQRDRLTLALWLSFLYVRGPSFRRQMEAMADIAFKMQMSLIRDEDTARAYLRRDGKPEPTDEQVRTLLDTISDLDEWEIAPHQNHMIKMMLNIGKEATGFFLGRFFAITKFPEPGLVLTDNPLVLFQRRKNAVPGLGVGLATADEIWLPLDRQTLLTLHTDKAVGEIVMRPPYGPLGPDLDKINEFIVSQAHREVYCHPDDVDRLERVTFPDPDRPVMTLNGAGWMRGSTDGVNKPPRRQGHHRYRPAR
jgi:hypothetical protein